MNISKPDIIKSVIIKDQGEYGTCYAHACSRNFVRTLQMFGIIKSKYNEQFYLLFLNFLTEHTICKGGNDNKMFELLHYLKNNYMKKKKFLKKRQPESMKCYKYECSQNNVNKPFINFTKYDEKEFIRKMDIVKDKLYVGKYEYIVDNENKENNYPSDAIIKLLKMRLQPYMSCNFFGNSNINGHAFNLRSWTNNYKIEIKNSWGLNWMGNEKGNHIYNNIIDFTTENNKNPTIRFFSLIFDFDILPELFKNDHKIMVEYYNNYLNLSYNKIKEDKYFIGEKKYGFFHDKGIYNNLLNEEYFDGTFLFGCKLKGNYKNKQILRYDGNWSENDKYNGKGIMTFIDGDKYDGNWKNSLYHGYGKMEFSTGEYYDGYWKNGLQHGKGTYKYISGIIYDGFWKNDLYNGIGKLVNNNRIYNGNWKNGKRKGYGVQIYSDNYVYEGNWKNNLHHGIGKLTINYNIYDGIWKNDLRSGYGKQIYSNGNVYDGDWKDDVYHGNGKLTYYNGDIYEGEWKYNLYNGKGKLTYNNGNTYEGDWKDDMFDGFGKLTYANGNIYEGEWENDMYNGFGKLTYNNGNIYEGKWIYNTYNGFGNLTYYNGDIYEGEWKDNLYNGLGKLIYNNDDTYEGEWKDNLYDGLGKLIYYNDNTYENDTYHGEWLKGERNGKGIQICVNSEWNNETKNCENISEQIKNNIQKYDGKWINNEFIFDFTINNNNNLKSDNNIRIKYLKYKSKYLMLKNKI